MAKSKIDFSEDVGPSNDSIKAISELAGKQLKLETEIYEIEQHLKDKEEDLRRITDVELPDAMTAAGISEFKLDDGTKVMIKDDMAVSVSKDKMPFVCGWLNEQGHGDVVKHTITVQLPKGTDPRVIASIEYELKERNMSYENAETVHTSTLKALLKEQREKGVDIELKKFGAFPYRKSQVKLPK